MRIVPVTGDLPAVVAAPWPAWVQAEPVTAPPAGTPPVTAAAASGTSTGTGAEDRSDRQRRPPQTPLQAAFDPPLIAQRAVLGLPIGPSVAALARQEGIPHAAASAAVDRAVGAVVAEDTAVRETRDGRPTA